MNAITNSTASLGQYLGHSLGAASDQTPTLFCNYQKDLVTGALDTSCDIKAPATPKAVEHVLNHVLNKKVKCTSVELQEGNLYHAPELAPLIEKVIQTEPARKLLNQALADGSIAFFMGDHRSAPGGASWRPKERQIHIRSDETPNRKLGHLFFEIANALQTKKQLALSKDTDEGKVSKESYVKRWEAIEFQTAKIFNSAVQECTSKHRWPKEADLQIPMLFRSPLEWNDYWKLIEHSNHADYFRSDWDHLARDFYCEKNPGKPDCR